MAEFTVTATRFDPYKNFRFRVRWDGRYVAGVTKVGALQRTTQVVEHRSGGDPVGRRTAPGRTSYEPVELERGVTHDTEFERWATELDSARKDVVIEVYNEAGQLAIAYTVHRCWVSKYQALPDLDASADAVAIQTLRLENEGWQRDTAVDEPAELP